MTDKEKELIEYAKAISQYCEDCGDCEKCCFGEHYAEGDVEEVLCPFACGKSFPYRWGF